MPFTVAQIDEQLDAARKKKALLVQKARVNLDSIRTLETQRKEAKRDEKIAAKEAAIANPAPAAPAAVGGAPAPQGPVAANGNPAPAPVAAGNANPQAAVANPLGLDPNQADSEDEDDI